MLTRGYTRYYINYTLLQWRVWRNRYETDE
jgi:hypothetical protein